MLGSGITQIKHRWLHVFFLCNLLQLNELSLSNLEVEQNCKRLPANPDHKNAVDLKSALE